MACSRRPGGLTAEEFELMMLECEQAEIWMQDQLKHSRTTTGHSKVSGKQTDDSGVADKRHE